MATSIPTEVFIQMGAYVFVFVITTALNALLMKGFYWKFYIVKISRGEKILIQFRNSLRDHYGVGKIQNEMLLFKNKGKHDEIAIPQGVSPIYRCLGVNCIQVEEASGTIVKPDFSTAPGFDHERFANLHARALQQPQVADNKEKAVLLLLILILIGVGACVYLGFTNSDILRKLALDIPELIKNIKVSISGGGI